MLIVIILSITFFIVYGLVLRFGIVRDDYYIDGHDCSEHAEFTVYSDQQVQCDLCGEKHNRVIYNGHTIRLNPVIKKWSLKKALKLLSPKN